MIGICLYSPKKEKNWGQIMRLACNFSVGFICTINSRYKRIVTDTQDAREHIPVFHYDSIENFLYCYPKECTLVSLEMDNNREINNFIHPKNVLYCFGPEDSNLPKQIQDKSIKLKINTNYCLNQAMCVCCVLFHKSLQKKYENPPKILLY